MGQIFDALSVYKISKVPCLRMFVFMQKAISFYIPHLKTAQVIIPYPLIPEVPGPYMTGQPSGVNLKLYQKEKFHKQKLYVSGITKMH